MKELKLVAIVVTFVTMIIFVASVSTAHGQVFCDGSFGEGTYIGGVFLPSARPDFHGVGYPHCGPADYADIYGRRVYRQFDQFGMLGWYPMAGVPYGGVWGRPTQGGYQPVLDAYERPFSGRQRIERVVGITILGGAIGATIGGERGGWIGTAIGVGGALINDSRYRSNKRGNEEKERAQPYPPEYQPPPQPPTVEFTPRETMDSQAFRRQSRQREFTYRVINDWPVDILLYYEGDPTGQTWPVRRRSSTRVPRREGVLTAIVVRPAADGTFKEESITVVGDGEKFQIPYIHGSGG